MLKQTFLPVKFFACGTAGLLEGRLGNIGALGRPAKLSLFPDDEDNLFPVIKEYFHPLWRYRGDAVHVSHKAPPIVIYQNNSIF